MSFIITRPRAGMGSCAPLISTSSPPRRFDRHDQGLDPSPAITAGLGEFNVLKVVKSGSQYAFYINNTLLHTFSDATHVASYLALALYCGGVSTAWSMSMSI